MARKSKGRLYQRGKSETWFLEYFVKGKKIREALRDPETNDPITDKTIAEKMRREIIEPMRVSDQAAKLRAMVVRAEQAENAAEQVMDLDPATAWERFESQELYDTAVSTTKDYRNSWKKFECFWTKGIRSFGSEDAKDFADILHGENLSAHRYNRILNLCDRVFYTAIGQKPFRVIKRRKGQTVGRREMTEKEIWDVIEAAKDYKYGSELRTMFLIGIYTGLRLVDASLLNVSEVDFDSQVLRVTPSKTKKKDKHLVIPIHKSLLPELAKCIPNKEGDLLPNLARFYRNNTRWLVRMIEKILEDQCIITKKDVGTARQRSLVGFHSLRHSFVSICAANGVPLPVVQELAGHGSPAIQRQYMHMGQKETTAAINSLPNFGEVPKVIPDLCFTRSISTESKKD